MFCSPALASRVDRAEGRLCAGIARAVAARSPEQRSEAFDVAGGVAVFAGSGSPTNKMIGIGFEGLPNESELDVVERAFADRGAPLQAEVSTLADPKVPALLVKRGYEPLGFENVLGHPLGGLGATPSAGILIERATADTLPEFTDVIVRGFASPDEQGVGGDTIPPSDEIRHWFMLTMSVPGFEGFVARVDGTNGRGRRTPARRRHRTFRGRGHAPRVPPTRRADGSPSLAPRARLRLRLRRRGRHDAARVEVAAERAARGISAALHAAVAREAAVTAGGARHVADQPRGYVSGGMTTTVSGPCPVGTRDRSPRSKVAMRPPWRMARPTRWASVTCW